MTGTYLDDPDAIAEQGPAGHHALYVRLQATPEFAELRHRYRAFVFPATLAFIAWYALYVLLSMWAHGFMSHKLFGNVNVALVFGLLQFVTTFALAAVYARYSNRHLDPLARVLDEQFDREI